MKTIARDSPLAELTLRKYEKPEKLSDRDLTRKVCLSLGLLQAGDSRDVVVDVLLVMLSHKEMTSEDVGKEVIALRKQQRLSLVGITGPNIRRQLLRLRGAFIVEKKANIYRITENASLTELFTEKIEQYMLPSILARVKEYLQETDKRFH